MERILRDRELHERRRSRQGFWRRMNAVMRTFLHLTAGTA